MSAWEGGRGQHDVSPYNMIDILEGFSFRLCPLSYVLLINQKYLKIFNKSKSFYKYRGFHEKGSLSYLWAIRDWRIVSIEWVYTPGTFYMKSAVLKADYTYVNPFLA